MPRNSKSKGATPNRGSQRDAAQIARIVLGVLVLLNLVAAWFVMYPPGGSTEQDLVKLQSQVSQAKVRLEQTKGHAVAVEKGRGDANEFLNRYFVELRTVPTTLLTELNQIAQRAGIKDRGFVPSREVIEGSEVLGMVTISWNFEGTYRNLLSFVHEIDRSSSLLIIDSLNAAPQAGTNILTVSMKLQAFVRDDGSEAVPKQANVSTVAEATR
ncbi:MAG: type 4a pilus biogenesis protein PilO [Acidobacteriota bacterium]